jgi:hypothetical protein
LFSTIREIAIYLGRISPIGVYAAALLGFLRSHSNSRSIYMQTEIPPQPVFTIKKFCERYEIAPSFFFKLQRQGKAPRTLRVGSKVLITSQAAADWIAAREAETAEQARVA